MTNGDRDSRFSFLSNLTQIMDSFSCSTTKYHILYWKHEKCFQKNPEYAEMRHGDIILTLH